MWWYRKNCKSRMVIFVKQKWSKETVRSLLFFCFLFFSFTVLRISLSDSNRFFRNTKVESQCILLFVFLLNSFSWFHIKFKCSPHEWKSKEYINEYVWRCYSKVLWKDFFVQHCLKDFFVQHCLTNVFSQSCQWSELCNYI